MQKRPKHLLRKGFTLLELMIVISIISILTAATLSILNSSQRKANLRGEVDKFHSYIQLLQSDAIAGKNSSDHGVYLETNTYTLFEGSTYNAVDPSNVVIDLSSSKVQIQNVSIGGGQSLVFSSPKGESAVSGSFDFDSTNSPDTLTINIDLRGNLTY
jgi:prepilin-type N-terminal cleavage/methylation domain-containing protein